MYLNNCTGKKKIHSYILKFHIVRINIAYLDFKKLCRKCYNCMYEPCCGSNSKNSKVCGKHEFLGPNMCRWLWASRYGPCPSLKEQPPWGHASFKEEERRESWWKHAVSLIVSAPIWYVCHICSCALGQSKSHSQASRRWGGDVPSCGQSLGNSKSV